MQKAVGAAFAVVVAALLPAQTRTPPPKEDAYRVVGAALTGASQVAQASTPQSKLEFDASAPAIVEAFKWAKTQSLAFVFEDDPVGPWYEAAEPGREAFCMRDVAHQSMGGHALGLARHNRNMLRRFAENVSDARDWCSYWEIDRFNRPAPVDYRNDAEFWYNLPANFDVLDACYRMYLWTGDLAYVNDPVFLKFYSVTVHDYVERWGLGLDQVMKRPRLLNVRGMPDPKKKFQINRGIPGYDEGNPGYVLGVDLLATQYAAYVAYSRIQALRGDEDAARTFMTRAAGVRALVNEKWWDEKEQYFYARLNREYKLEGRAGSGLLYRDIVDGSTKIAAALKEGRPNVEALYRYGDPDAAYRRMLDIAQREGSRREYPEVPYAWIGALVNGMMGITIEAPSGLDSRTQGWWVEAVLKTVPNLGAEVAWAELRHVPVRAGEISVRHEGARKTTLTNTRGPALIWEANFRGAFPVLLVNGRPVRATGGQHSSGQPVSTVRVTVGSGGTVTVETLTG